MFGRKVTSLNIPRPEAPAPPPVINLTLDDAIAYLNDLLERDSDAVNALCYERTECNGALAGHPSCQVLDLKNGHYRVGLLGIFNGMFGSIPEGHKRAGQGYIAALGCPVEFFVRNDV